jgi:glycosyltransferase involved in cell wall biosynthesis
MTNTPPKVSVLMPTLNYARFLPEAIESVLNQTLTDFELIIVDNGSTDETDEVVQRYLGDERVKYYKNYTKGMAGNWNKCIEYSKGTYLKFLCADDKFHPELLEKFVAIMETHPNVSVVTSYRENFGRPATAKDARTLEEWKARKYLQEGKKVILDTLQTFNWIGEPTAVMFRRSNLKLGLFRTDLVWLCDWEMWLRHLTVGDCYMIPEALSYIRKHPGSGTESLTKKGYSNYFEDYDFYKSLATSKEYDFGVPPADMQMMLKHRAKNCAKAMLKSLPKVHQKIFRGAFVKGFKIAYSEKVIADTLFQVGKNYMQKDKAYNSSAELA